MLSEIQGASRPPMAPQPRAAVPAPASSAELAAPVPVASAPVTASVESRPEVSRPKIQAPKPIEVKVDIEKMRANLQDSLEKLNAALRDGGRNLNFQMDDKAGGWVVLVKNSDTGEIVRQIPNDAIVRMARSIEAFKGMLHNEFS